MFGLILCIDLRRPKYGRRKKEVLWKRRHFSDFEFWASFFCTTKWNTVIPLWINIIRTNDIFYTVSFGEGVLKVFKYSLLLFWNVLVLPCFTSRTEPYFHARIFGPNIYRCVQSKTSIILTKNHPILKFISYEARWYNLMWKLHIRSVKL